MLHRQQHRVQVVRRGRPPKHGRAGRHQVWRRQSVHRRQPRLREYVALHGLLGHVRHLRLEVGLGAVVEQPLHLARVRQRALQVVRARVHVHLVRRDQVRHVRDRERGAAAQVDHLAVQVLVLLRQDQALHDVGHVDEVAVVRPVALDRQRLALGRLLGEHARHDGVRARARLPRAVHHEEARRDGRHAEQPVEHLHLDLALELAGRVRRQEVGRHVLAVRRRPVAVVCRRRRVDHLADVALLPHRVQHVPRPQRVRLRAEARHVRVL